MKKITVADVADMPAAERLLLVEDIWDSIAAMPEAVPLTDAQRMELERRLEAYHKNPDAGSAWNQVKARVRQP